MGRASVEYLGCFFFQIHMGLARLAKKPMILLIFRQTKTKYWQALPLLPLVGGDSPISLFQPQREVLLYRFKRSWETWIFKVRWLWRYFFKYFMLIMVRFFVKKSSSFINRAFDRFYARCLWWFWEVLVMIMQKAAWSYAEFMSLKEVEFEHSLLEWAKTLSAQKRYHQRTKLQSQGNTRWLSISSLLNGKG